MPPPPAAVRPLDIDDTVDVVHGHRRLPLFDAHYNGAAPCRPRLRHGNLPRPVRGVAAARQNAVRREVRGHLRRLVLARSAARRRDAADDPGDAAATRRPEVIASCEDDAIDYVFGLPATVCCVLPSRPLPSMSACVVPRPSRRSAALQRHTLSGEVMVKGSTVAARVEAARSASTSALSSPPGHRRRRAGLRHLLCPRPG